MKLTAIQRSEVKRAEYISELQEFKPEMLVFIDETAVTPLESMVMD